MQGVLVPLCFYLTHRQEKPTGIAFVDSSQLQVCHNLRILRYQVVKGTAPRLSKQYLTSMIFERLLMQVYVGDSSGTFINIKTELRKPSNL
ncbi:Mobile element protein [Candidatus Enterovibrio escicola]|uniref:Mobile element protein n=1 Tax=Candidatus Enterovibrio escicola TaxID=1927127 RepID=A0A2A5T5V2_9GAMM|nr:Mobile element protein [Candidatus Enterovibrio escacola]